MWTEWAALTGSKPPVHARRPEIVPNNENNLIPTELRKQMRGTHHQEKCDKFYCNTLLQFKIGLVLQKNIYYQLCWMTQAR